MDAHEDADRAYEALGDAIDTEGRFYILVTEQHAISMASGYVPNSVKTMIRTMLDWREEDERRAERPVRTRPKKKATA